MNPIEESNRRIRLMNSSIDDTSGADRLMNPTDESDRSTNPID